MEAEPQATLESKSTRNERLKLLAATLNGVGLAILALGLLQPLFAGALDLSRMVVGLGSLILFFALHLAARAVLRDLKD